MENKEPPLLATPGMGMITVGLGSRGLNKAWLDWYRNHGNGHSLREAVEEAKRRIRVEKENESNNRVRPKQ